MAHVFNVVDFGAVADGKTLSTAALQRAIDAAAERGGRVVVPSGRFLTGTIVLKSKVTLELEQGAVLLGSTNLKDYITHTWGHHMDITPWHLVLAEDAADIVIEGEGTIDGNGPSFWEQSRPHEWAFWKTDHHRVSPMIHLHRCKRVRIENVTMTRSAGWTLHLHDCDEAILRGLHIHNTFFGPNTDGIDLTGAQNVTISDCHISTGDDAIALKTNEYSRSCENIAISNCVLATSCVAIRLGYESRQDFRNIVASNCVVTRCSRVIDLRSLEGANIEHVSFSNIVATTNSGWPVNRPIEISLHKRDSMFKASLDPMHHDYGKDKPVARIGYVRDVTFRDIDIVTDGRITFVADEDGDIGDIYMSNVRLRYVLCDDVRSYAPKGGSGYLPGDHADARGANAALVMKNVHDVTVRDFSIHWPVYPMADGWYLLASPHRTAGVYVGQEEAVRTGEQRCVYKVIWAKNVRRSRFEFGELRASDGGEPVAQG